MTKLRHWQPDVPELRTEGDEQDPVVSLRLSGVDINAILDQAANVDNLGQRRQKIRELVTEALNLAGADTLLPLTRTWVWRGSKRTVDVRFANVRDETDIPSSEFKADGRPRVIIDFPFDEANHGPQDDLVRIQVLQAELYSTPTVAWLPSFFTEEALAKLGQLVVVDYVLTGDRLQNYTGFLAPQNRIEAKHLLENQRASLRDQVQGFLRKAYGIDVPDGRFVSSTLSPSDQFPTLDPTLTIQPPVAATLSDAFDQLLDEVMTHRFPAHPEFESEVRIGDLRTALKHVERAMGERDHRVGIPTPDRQAVRKVLGPLMIATTGEAHIVLERHWKDHFQARQAADPGRAVTVERLKEWIDTPTALGLEDRVANLVISSYALMDDRVMVIAGQALDPTVDRLEPQTEVREQALPTADEWDAARPVAEVVFGVPASPLLNAANVARLVGEIRRVAKEHESAARGLVEALLRATSELSTGTDTNRLRTATAVKDLAEAVADAGDVEVVRSLAGLAVPTSTQAMGRSLKSAGTVSAAVNTTQWEVFGLVAGLPGVFGEKGQALRQRVVDALAQDELACALPEVLQTEQGLATKLLAEAAGGGGPTPPTPPQPEARALGTEGREEGLSAADAKPILAELSQRSDELAELDVRWRFKTEG